MKKIIASITILAIVLSLVGCLPQGAVEFDINFIVDDEIYDVISTDRSSIKMPLDPEKENHEFDGWFWDKDIWEKPLTLSSLLDAPLSENMRVYAKFTSLQNNDISAKFYQLQHAYDLGILSVSNLYDISFYNNGYVSDYPPFSRLPFPKNPEFLSSETENQIKQSFLDEYYLTAGSTVEYSIEDISISKYCGTYNGVVVVMIDGLYGYFEAMTSETVAGIKFNYNNSNYLRGWVEEDRISLAGVSITTRQEFYTEDVKTIEVFLNNETNRTISYGQSFHIEKKIDGVWCEVFTDKEAIFPMIGYHILPYSMVYHSYPISTYTDKLDIGDYRIVAGFSSINKKYWAYAEFAVVPSIQFRKPQGKIDFTERYLFKVICSVDELKLLASSFDKEYYDDAYFTENAIIVLKTATPSWAAEVVNIELQKRGDVLAVCMYYSYRTNTAVAAIGYFAAVMEVDKADLDGITGIRVF